MKIGIDARMINASGIGRYITNLLNNLVELDKENEYFVFLKKSDLNSIDFQNKNFQKVEADFNWYSFQEQISFPSVLYKYRLDLMHFPHFNIPVFYNGKFVVTLHDLTHYDFKMSRASMHNRLYYEIKHQVHKLVMFQAFNKSKKIITVSNFVKDELIRRFKIRKSKIEVTYESGGRDFIKMKNKLTKNQEIEILEKFSIKKPYLFYIGNTHPHKNVEGLIEAYLKLRNNYQYLQLVIAGTDDFFLERIKVKYQHKDIIYTGFVTDEQLTTLYLNAQAFVFPSFSEGFGIPILEAFALSCPVVLSNKTALPEVGGEACLYFDPYNIDDMAEKISKVLNDQKLREYLIKKGLKRYKLFSWEKLAKETLKVYQSV